MVALHRAEVYFQDGWCIESQYVCLHFTYCGIALPSFVRTLKNKCVARWRCMCLLPPKCLLVRTSLLYSPPSLLDPIAISIIRSWLHFYQPGMSIEETLGFFRLPQGDSEAASGEIQSALPSSGRLATLRTTGRLKADGSWDPSVLPEFFFWWKFLFNFRILWTQKKVTQKQTHFRDLRWWLFSMDLLREETVERRFDGMEADWSFGDLGGLA